MVDNDMPGAWPVWTPEVPLAAFIKESTIQWSTQHMKALGHMVSEKKFFFLCFSHDAPSVGPAWTPGARLAGFIAGFIKRTTLHCYTQNMKAVKMLSGMYFACSWIRKVEDRNTKVLFVYLFTFSFSTNTFGCSK